MTDYRVKQGDCLSSIADRYGFFVDTIWEHARNAELREKRKDPNILLEGDSVFIPEKERKEESGATEQRHRFVLKGVPVILRLRVLLDDGTPRSNATYLLTVDGTQMAGSTDGNGVLEHPIPPAAKQALLRWSEEDYEYELDLGHADPIGESSGVQTRLNNLGFGCGAVDGHLGPRTETALEAFQTQHGLPVTGIADDATRSKLEEEHGS